MVLSKSQYIRGLQCHKSLWLYKNRPELKDTIDQAKESLFNKGYDVGELAKQLFPNGIEIEYDANNFGSMLAKTKELIDNGCEVIYEATFKENGISVMADIFVKNADTWDMYEVKASTKIKDYHIDDASIQWYALNNSINLNKAYIVHINKNYVRDGELDVNELFTIVDVTDEVQDRQFPIPFNLEQIEQMLNEDMPDIDIGTHCSDPNRCDFQGHCWKHIPYPSVFNLYWMNSNKKFEIYYKGMKTYEDIPNDFKLNTTQKLQIDTYKSKNPYIDKSIIKEFLDTIEYPINFFDFETFQNAIPRFDNQRPYMQIPFQYSLHILYEDGTMEHKEFLGDENSDPRNNLINQMLEDITPTGSIVAYNQSFEQSMIKELAQFDESKKDQLLSLNERFVDLIVPFRGRGYYHPDFNGSFSIKSVLPAMFPNDPELDYKKLGSIQNGGDAMDTFANLHLLKDESKRDDIRSDLLAYCHLDTLAMVRIWEKLNNIVYNKSIKEIYETLLEGEIDNKAFYNEVINSKWDKTSYRTLLRIFIDDLGMWTHKELYNFFSIYINRNNLDISILKRIEKFNNKIQTKRIKKAKENTKSADFIITNPTHYCIAVRYFNKKFILLAKGLDYAALKMKEVAVSNNIPIVEDPPMARAIYEQVEIGDEIDDIFTKALMEVFQYIQNYIEGKNGSKL